MAANHDQQSIAYDGNAALKMTAPEAPARQRRVQEQKKKKSSSEKPQTVPQEKQAGKTAPVAMAAIFAVAAVIILMLISYAHLVMVNDQVVTLRNTLSDLKTEETKLMAQYELAYDLQEIETQMLTSGQMTKIQSWQTYTLELAEPDSVEYYQSSDFRERVVSFAKSLVSAVVEYF